MVKSRPRLWTGSWTFIVDSPPPVIVYRGPWLTKIVDRSRLWINWDSRLTEIVRQPWLLDYRDPGLIEIVDKLRSRTKLFIFYHIFFVIPRSPDWEVLILVSYLLKDNFNFLNSVLPLGRIIPWSFAACFHPFCSFSLFNCIPHWDSNTRD